LFQCRSQTADKLERIGEVTVRFGQSEDRRISPGVAGSVAPRPLHI
jgi:hypothetical protein